MMDFLVEALNIVGALFMIFCFVYTITHPWIIGIW